MTRVKSTVPWSWPNPSLTRVIDGDSLVMRLTKVTTIDIGFHGTVSHQVDFDQKLRLNRVNAPKASSAAGKTATAYLTNLLTTVGLGNDTITETYKYGDEWMVEITLKDGTNVSDVMVSSGHAVYWNGEGPRPSDG